MPRDPFPRFPLGAEATHRGWIAAGYDNLDAEAPIFQRNSAVGRPSVRMRHRHGLYMAC